MKFKEKIGLFFILLLCAGWLSAQTDITLDLTMRFFEGLREGGASPPEIVTSSYLQPMITAKISSKFEIEEEKRQIKKVFNLKDVSLITEAPLRWEAKKGKILMHFFRLNGKQYQVSLNPILKEFVVSPRDKTADRSYKFLIHIFEQTGDVKKSLMETEVIVPEKNIAVFGFEDNQGKPYFLSFHVTGVSGKLIPPPPPTPPPPPPPPPEIQKKIEEMEKGAVKVTGDISPPKLIKKINPVYPEEARRKGVMGIVTLSVRTDETGAVEQVLVLRSIPELDKAAVYAIKQWKYEPVFIEGKATPIVFTVTVRFNLQ